MIEGLHPICPYCGEFSKLIDTAEIYGRSYGMAYICWPCDAYVGCHKGTTKPKGRLANKELREWKKRAHAAFDPLWQTGKMKRPQAYKLLAETLGIPREEAHIGMFDVELCRRTVAAMTTAERCE